MYIVKVERRKNFLPIFQGHELQRWNILIQWNEIGCRGKKKVETERRFIRPAEDAGTSWIYLDSAEVLDEAGLYYEIEHYIQKRRDTISEFVTNREIYQKCKAILKSYLIQFIGLASQISYLV